MAEREELILEIRAELDRATSDVKDLERQLKELEDVEPIELELDAEGAEADVQAIADELEGIKDQDIKLDVDAADAKAAAEDLGLEFETTEQKIKSVTATIEAMAEAVDAELRESKAAADALGQALGPELSGKVNVNEIVGDLQRLGLTTGEIRGNADQLAASFRQVDSIRTQGLADGLDYTNTRMTGLRNNADQSRSVLANLAGNSAQDLGELGGVVGSLGVGIGQLAEYAVDGNIALGNLAKVAIPMAAVAGVTLAIRDNLADAAKIDAFQTEKIEAYTDAIRDGATEMEALREQAEALGGVEVVLQGEFLIDLTEKLQAAGVTLAQWNELVLAGPDAITALQAAWERSGELSEDQRIILLGLVQAQEDYASGARNAARDVLFAAESIEEMQEHLDSLRDPLSIMSGQWDILINDLRDGQLDMAHAEERIKALAEATNLSTDAVIERAQQELDRRLEDEADAAGEAAGKWEVLTGAIDKSGDAAEDTTGKFDVTTGAIDKSGTATEDAAGKFDVVTGAIDKSAAAMQGLSDELGDIVSGFDFAALRGDAFTSALADINRRFSELDASGQTITFVERMRSLSDALAELGEFEGDIVPDSWGEVLAMPEELGPVQDALRQFRDIIQSEFTQAFEQGGSPEARQWAADTRAAIETELRESGRLTEDQVQEIIGALGLLPDQVDLTISISAADQARAVIDDMATAIAALPLETQLQITALAATDPVAALQLAIDALEDAGVEVPATLILLQDQLQADADAAVAEVTPPTIRVPTELEIAGAGGKTFAGGLADALSAAADDATPPVITPTVDQDPAEEEIAELTDAEYTATIGTDADLTVAANELDGFVNQQRTADVDVDALLGDFEREMTFATRDRSVTVDVGTGNVNMPSPSQLVSLATGGQGSIRVPLVGVWSTRIEGSRPR